MPHAWCVDMRVAESWNLLVSCRILKWAAAGLLLRQVTLTTPHFMPDDGVRRYIQPASIPVPLPIQNAHNTLHSPIAGRLLQHVE